MVMVMVMLMAMVMVMSMLALDDVCPLSGGKRSHTVPGTLRA